MPDAAELVAAADTLSEASLYNEAISTYTKAIELTPAPTYYIKRSTAYQRSGNLTAALSDAEQAVILGQKRGKAELIAAAQIRRGISLNGLKRFSDSNAVFQFAKNAGSKDKSIDIWISKNNRELAKLSEEEKKPTVETIPNELSYSIDHTTASQEVKKNVSDDTTVVEKEIHKTEETPKAPEKTESSEKAKIPEPVPHPAPIPSRVRHEWYQTDQYVFIDIFFKNIPKDKCAVDIDPTSLTVTFPLPSGSDFTFTLDPLFSTIVPESSSYEILSTKLSVKLQKSTRAWKWPCLENTESTVDSPPTATAAPIAYPTSSRTGVKNWDALEREAIKDAETWEKPDGDAAANALFRDLFKNATPEVRRAMEKSYIESNGTALSTNWEEVSKGRVETKPPDSMVAKAWEK